MEEIGLIASRTVAEAENRKKLLIQAAWECHDCITAKEMELVNLQQEIGALHQEKSRLVEESKQAGQFAASAWESWESAWKSMKFETKWNKNVLLTVFYRYFSMGKKTPLFVEQSIQEEAPDSIRDDRDVLLCRLSTSTWNVRPDAPADFSFLLPNNEQFDFAEHLGMKKGIFERLLWKDKAVAAATVKLYPEALRNNLVSSELLNDKDVFLAFTETNKRFARRTLPFFGDCDYPQTPWTDEQFRALVARFSEDIRKNADLMLALVKKCGLCLQYVDESLKGNRDIIQAAFEQNLEALFLATDQARRDLLASKPFAYGFLSTPFFWSSTHYRLTWLLYQLLPEFLQCDRDIVDSVLRYGYCYRDAVDLSDDFPAAVLGTQHYWLSASLHLDSSLLRPQLPDEFRNDREIAEVLSLLENLEHPLGAPRRVGDRTVWENVINANPARHPFFFEQAVNLPSLIQDRATAEIRHDRALMLLACKRDAKVYAILDDRLKEDREILAAAIDSGTDFFFSIPWNVQSLHPDLTVKALEQLSGDEHFWFHQIPPDLWSNVAVAIAALEAFSYESDPWEEMLPWDFPEAMKDNAEFGLAIAKKHWQEPTRFAAHTSVALRSNKAFMMGAIAISPDFLSLGHGGLAKDSDLALLAFSQQVFCRWQLFGDREDDPDYDYAPELEFLYSVAAKAREKVVTFEGFTQGFLDGLILECALPTLIGDEVTSTGLKKVIAEFAGVPRGGEVARLRAASLNLLFM